MIKQDQANEIRNIWQAVRDRMNQKRVTPATLSDWTRYSVDHILRGLRGELIPITLGFLRGCVLAFGLTSGRTKYYEETVEDLSSEECVDLIRPKPTMPPRQGNFWENANSHED